MPIDRLSDLARALTLPVDRAMGSVGKHIIYRGGMIGFDHRLTECKIPHEFTVDPEEGCCIALAGLVVERGSLGGVLVREPGEHDEMPGVGMGGAA